MQMNDEISGIRLVDGRLGFRLPGVVRHPVVWEYADNIERRQIAEAYVVDRFQRAAEDEMKQLWRVVGFLHTCFRHHKDAKNMASGTTVGVLFRRPQRASS